MAALRREMLISHDSHETRVALLENRALVELYVERPRRSVVGNVYLGKIKDVLPGMQAAFVDIGLEKNAFLYVDEVVAFEGVEAGGRRSIADILAPGEDVMVQVLKDPMGTKGARVTTDITLPGRFTVLMPYSSSVGVSRRLPEAERDRLHAVVIPLVPDGMGAIVRTVAEGVSDKEVAGDLEFLLRLWKRVKHQAEEGLAPEVVYTEMDLALRIVRDVFSAGFERLIVDDKALHAKLVSFIKKSSPELVRAVMLHRERTPLFEAHGVLETVDSALRRTVELPSGGSIAIDRTEALTAIDVNSGRFVGRKSLEDTAYRTNLEAAEEIARQLRLRDIGGIIVIDFIDMEESAHRSAVVARLSAALERDRTRTRVGEMSRLGLVEMTRKNVTEGAFDVITEECPCCGGEGRVLSAATRRIAVERTMREMLEAGRASAYLLGVHPQAHALLVTPGNNIAAALKEQTSKTVVIVPDAECGPLEVRVLIEGSTGQVRRGIKDVFRSA
ncbi:MAG: Rne/Rng family ribonuclease [Clostridiales bacterium]|nr:Rne/Rng family ribonuclease [Clostridiales bacterium]